MSIDVNKLAGLSTEALQELKKGIEVVLASRLDTQLRPGRIGTFEQTHRHGEKELITVRVEKINQKTVSCVSVYPSKHVGHKWRVGINLLKIVPEEREVPKPLPVAKVAAKPHVPITAGADW